MSYSNCDGSFIDESMAAVYDGIAESYRQYPEHFLHSYEARQRDARANRSVRRYETAGTETETRLVAALVTVADRMGAEERAVVVRPERRDGDPDEDEATRIVREHGFSLDRLVALRGLARSRDVELEVVLRAALRGGAARHRQAAASAACQPDVAAPSVTYLAPPGSVKPAWAERGDPAPTPMKHSGGSVGAADGLRPAASSAR